MWWPIWSCFGLIHFGASIDVDPDKIPTIPDKFPGDKFPDKDRPSIDPEKLQIVSDWCGTLEIDGCLGDVNRTSDPCRDALEIIKGSHKNKWIAERFTDCVIEVLCPYLPKYHCHSIDDNSTWHHEDDDDFVPRRPGTSATWIVFISLFSAMFLFTTAYLSYLYQDVLRVKLGIDPPPPPPSEELEVPNPLHRDELSLPKNVSFEN